MGTSTANKLNRHCINTIGDLAATDIQTLQNLFGNKTGTHLHRYANGIDNSPVSSEKEDAKGYSNSTTLADNVTKFETASNILLALVDTTSARMRYDRKKAYCIQVTIRDTKFKDHSHQRELERVHIKLYKRAKML